MILMVDEPLVGLHSSQNTIIGDQTVVISIVRLRVGPENFTIANQSAL